MGNVRSLAGVAAVDHASRVADGLEGLAAQIRAGRFRFEVLRGVVVLGGRSPGPADDFDTSFFGAEASVFEVVGLLEMAKLGATQPDG